MLGPPKLRHLDQPILQSIEELVPSDSFYRHVEATLDLSFVRTWVQDCYAASGRPSIDPVVFFKLQLILFFEGLRSERQLMRVVADRLSLRWYLGYDFGDEPPHHSSLTRIRARYGRATFQRFFERIVELCQEAGLVWGQELIFDATRVQANAALGSLVPRFYLKAMALKVPSSLPDVAAHVDTLFGEDPTPELSSSASPEPTIPVTPDD